MSESIGGMHSRIDFLFQKRAHKGIRKSQSQLIKHILKEEFDEKLQNSWVSQPRSIKLSKFIEIKLTPTSQHGPEKSAVVRLSRFQTLGCVRRVPPSQKQKRKKKLSWELHDNKWVHQYIPKTSNHTIFFPKRCGHTGGLLRSKLLRPGVQSRCSPGGPAFFL